MPNYNIAFPTTSSKPGSLQENGGKLINAFVEKLADGRGVMKRAPGLNRVASSASRVLCRGMYLAGSTLLVAYQDRLESVDAAFVNSDLGALAGSGPVTIARNNRTPTPQIVAVTENGAFNLFTSAAPTAFADPDLPNPNSVCFQDGYFFFTIGDGRCYASGINEVTINSLDFIICEARSDGLLRGIAFRQELFLMGQSSIEVWQNTAQPTGFPYSRATVIPRGLKGQWAVSGWEEGFANTLIWVGDDNIVYQLAGYTPQRISYNDIERDLETISDGSQLKAISYMSGGHALWSLKSPSFTWVYDLSTNQWHNRKSFGRMTFRGEQAVKAFGMSIVGDEATGHLYSVDDRYYYEDGEPLVLTIESGPGSGFPTRMSVPLVMFDMDVGTGIPAGVVPIETDPVIQIAWSDDGGATWSMPVIRDIGRGALYRNRIDVSRTGLTTQKGRNWKLWVSDAVYVGLLGGNMTVEQRAP